MTAGFHVQICPVRKSVYTHPTAMFGGSIIGGPSPTKTPPNTIGFTGAGHGDGIDPSKLGLVYVR